MGASTPSIGASRGTLPLAAEQVSDSSLDRYSRWGLYATIAALPLYTVRWHYGPIPTTLLETLILVTVVLYVVARWREGARGPVATPYDIPVLVLLAAAGISVLVASDHRAALGLYRAYFLEPIALFYVAVDIVRRTEHLRRLLIAFAIGSSLFAVLNLVVFYQALTANTVQVGVAPNALYGDANYVAMYMEPPFAMAAALVLLGERARLRIAGVAWLALIGAALITSFSKGTYAAVLVFALLVMLTVPRWRWAVGAAIAAAVVVATQVPLLMARLATVVSSMDGRREIFVATLAMLRDSPIFGLGLGGFTYQLHGIVPHPYPHNLWLAFWVETGIAGAVAFAIILFGLLWRGWRAWPRTDGFERIVLWGALGALSLWLVHGLVDTPYWKNDMSVEFWMLAAIQVVVVPSIAGGMMARRAG
jgi:putative inorganic carbon (HCO3(-)) transporter